MQRCILSCSLRIARLANLAAQLVAAIEAGDAAAVEAALAAGASPDTEVPGDSRGPKVLHLACERGDLICVQALLAAGANPRSYDGEARTPIYYVYSGSGDARCAAALLAAGESREEQLCAAVAGGSAAGVGEALAGGADPNLIVDFDNDRPYYDLYEDGWIRAPILHVACCCSSLACVQALLAAGADPTLADELLDTALAWARRTWPRQNEEDAWAIAAALLAAAPELESLQPRKRDGNHEPPSPRAPCLPLRKALARDRWQLASSMLESGPLLPVDDALQALAWGRRNYDDGYYGAYMPLALYVPLVARQPLSPAQWKRVPHPCAALSAALPAVLARSEAEAALLMRHLMPGHRARLRTAALCLARAQRTHRTPLPLPILRRMLLALVEPHAYAFVDEGYPSSSVESEHEGDAI